MEIKQEKELDCEVDVDQVWWKKQNIFFKYLIFFQLINTI